MYKMTERRLATAQPILDRYHNRLLASGRFDAHGLESELRTALSLGYREVKDLMSDLLRSQPQYEHVAAFFMEKIYPTGPASAFKIPLAKLYGVRSYHAEEMKKARSAYWAKAGITLSVRSV